MEQYIGIILLAVACEAIDSGLGMGYGTILSPLLIALGFEPLIVVPSILISQAAGGMMGAFNHHKKENADFSFGSDDMKTVMAITSLGIVATVIGSFAAINISKTALNTYIGTMATIIGVTLLTGFQLKYSTLKMVCIGAVSAFNKGFSGGGYGPIVTGGQVVLGKEHRNSIGCTTAAEVPICLAGFGIYLATNNITSYYLLISLTVGAIIGGILGPIMTERINKKVLKLIVGTMITLLGLLVLCQIIGIIPNKFSI
ncbi:MAG: sulfite exporter TauE/SafE family protein [Candidatus Staskawiczbacteria bacterium]|nr:sulfite exporter TauE/SafE family protein [Candidatus Staskawiczbacteria bacterium]